MRDFLRRTWLWRMVRPLVRRIRRPRLIARQSRAAKRYCVGRGLEIGASAQNPFGLDTRNVDFTDAQGTVFKEYEKTVVGQSVPVDIVASAEDIPLPDSSEDFVVSSHVLEHLVDPIRGLLEWDRLVRPGGVIFTIVPHKERTFDRERSRTSLEHLIEDYEKHRTESETGHGHEHVWITEDIVELAHWMMENAGVAWELLEVQDVDDKVGNGFTVVIRKLADRLAVRQS